MGFVRVILSDGASVPKWERKRIIKKYGQHTMDKIDWCGYRHDARMECQCQGRDLARALFYVDLISQDLPVKLVERLYIGLFIYDKVPTFIKLYFKKSVDDSNLKKIKVVFYDDVLEIVSIEV